MLNYKSDNVRILFNFLEKSSVQCNGETANEKLRYTYNTVGADADGLWITLHSRMDKSEVQTMQDVGDAMALVGYAATLSVVGAEVGVPLMVWGNRISEAGTGLELCIDWINGDIPNNGIILHGALFIKDQFNIHWYNNLVDDLTPTAREVIVKGSDLKRSLFERAFESANQKEEKNNQ